MAAFKKCPWTPEEDMQLVTYIRRYGIWNWSQMPKHAGKLLINFISSFFRRRFMMDEQKYNHVIMNIYIQFISCRLINL